MNQLKTTVILALLSALLIGIGYYFGGASGALVALIISAIMNFASYWYSDKIVLSIYGARPTQQSDNPGLYDMVQRLAIKAGMPMPKIYMVNLPTPNAFATGRNEQHAVVAVSESILKILDSNELEGVLAHELSHIKDKDILVSSVAATIAGAISYIAQMAYWGGFLFGGSGNDREGRNNAFGMIVLIILAPIVATLLHLAVSRSREFLADEQGARLSGNPSGLANALIKLDNVVRAYPLQGQPKHEATAHLFIVNPFKNSVLMSLFSTHPPVEERVRRLLGGALQ